MAEALPREDLKDVEDVVLKVENEDLRSDDESPNQHSPGRLTPIGWVKLQMELGVRPEELLQHMLGPTVQLPSNADEVSLWEAVLELVLRPPPRPLLDHVTSLDDVVGLIEQSQKIIVLSGAGMSVSCGIPDFRSPDGLYAKLAVLYPELTDPQSMFDIKFFQLDPRPFFNFAKEIFPGKYQPSVSHRFVKTLEEKGKLLRNYTQNIDTLEQSAGIERVIYCHGSFMTATCRKCKFQAPIDTIKDDIMNESIPYCAKCCNSTQSANETEDSESDEDELGIMKPDIVFFGEGLPDSFHQQLHEDKTQVSQTLGNND
jgi:NAD-dependent deacetylase sirtuin 1